jgi:hypothetical protein
MGAEKHPLPNDVHILILGPVSKLVTLHNKEDFADMIRLKSLK